MFSMQLGRHLAQLTVASFVLVACASTTPDGEQTNDSKATKQKDYFQRPGAKVSEIVQARGYVAEELTFITDDGYILGITRATNPLVSADRTQALGREPLLFVHGTLVDGNSFVMNSFDVDGPKDFTEVNVNGLSEHELVERFQGEPSAKSLAFFALNCGHEAWFLHRRGAPLSRKRIKIPIKPPTVMEKLLDSERRFESRRKLNRRSRRSPEQELGPTTSAPIDAQSSSRPLPKRRDNSRLIEAVKAAPAALFDYGNLALDIKTTLNKRLWNHSFDEQAAYDLPRAVDFVLEKTGFERVAMVGDSSGGQLILQTLVLEPNLGAKLSKAICWVPSFNIGHGSQEQTFGLIQPLFDYVGPFPFTFVSNPLQALMEVACGLEVMQLTLCTLTADANWGNSEGRATLRPEFQSAYMTSVSAHEYLQLIQTMHHKQTRMFDFRDKKKNLLAYGQEVPPHYNLSLIDFEHISIYWGTSDSLVNKEDIQSIHNDLRVPHRIVIMDAPGSNHGGVLFHDQVDRMVIIPTYKDIISHGSGERRLRRKKSKKFNNKRGQRKS